MKLEKSRFWLGLGGIIENLLYSSCRRRWFHQTPPPAWRRSLCFWRCSACESPPCRPPGWWSRSVWSRCRPVGWRNPRLGSEAHFNTQTKGKDQSKGQGRATDRALSCNHQNSRSPPVSRLHRRRRPWWRVSRRPSDLESTLRELQRFKFPPRVLLLCSLLLCVGRWAEPRVPLAQETFPQVFIGGLNWVRVLLTHRGVGQG